MIFVVMTGRVSAELMRPVNGHQDLVLHGQNTQTYIEHVSLVVMALLLGEWVSERVSSILGQVLPQTSY